ncbi:MAG: hypothetical protein KJO50_02370, partial [Bacteroidia bacterium]|nr:hypothetical protein [Bacteroidia bacterium]
MKYILLFVLMMSYYSCIQNSKPSESFSGEQEAIQMAEEMFDAIGGMEGWCNLESVYIQAEHTEPQMTLPYQSEIWRNMSEFDVIIEQQNDSFHVRGVMNDTSGIVTYLDDRDTFRVMYDEQLIIWKFGNKHNVYVVLHDLA